MRDPHRRRDKQKVKLAFIRLESAQNAANALRIKYDWHLDVYKCSECLKYHLGKQF